MGKMNPKCPYPKGTSQWRKWNSLSNLPVMPNYKKGETVKTATCIVSECSKRGLPWRPAVKAQLLMMIVQHDHPEEANSPKAKKNPLQELSEKASRSTTHGVVSITREFSPINVQIKIRSEEELMLLIDMMDGSKNKLANELREKLGLL